MTQGGPSGPRSPEQLREEHIRRHQEARRRARRERAVMWTLVAAAVVLALVAAVVVGSRWVGGQVSPEPASMGSGASPSPLPAAAISTPESAQQSPAPTEAATATAEPSATPTPEPTRRPTFKSGPAMQDVRTLAGFGVRSAGSSAEARAAEWAADRMRAAGAEKVKVRTFKLTDGKTSRNVIGRFPGSTGKTIVIGGHMDTKAPSAGANDNSSGSAAVLEIARCLGEMAAYPTVVVVLFGSEEMIDSDPDHHHFGSRHYVASMSGSEKDATAGMVSVDMIGYGPDFVVRTMGRGPQTMRYLLLAEAKRQGMSASYLVDPGESGWSDHEAFELAGIPAAWIEWRDDPVYHTTGDTPGHLSAAKVRAAGQLVLSMLYGLDERRLRKLER